MTRGRNITARERQRIISDLTRLPFSRVVRKTGRAPSTIAKIVLIAMREGEIA